MTPEVKHMLGGWRVGHLMLQAAGYTVQAYGAHAGGNNTLDANTPIGLIAGHLVKATAAEEVGLAGADELVLGMNLFNVNEVAAYYNNFAEASERITFLVGKGALAEVNVYETRNAADTADLDYSVAGTVLYSSAQGLLTTEGANNPVAVVLVPPTADSQFMQVMFV